METLMGNAMGGITKIVSFMEDIKIKIGQEFAPRVAGVELGACTPPQWYVTAHPKNTPLAGACKSHTSSAKESASEKNVARGTCSPQPPVVLLDTSSQSAENQKKPVQLSPHQNCPGRRVHNNPRIHPVPFLRRLAVTRPSTSHDRPPEGPTAAPPSRTTRYKDPPGYDDAVDFGRTSDSPIKLPVLRPKNNSVIYFNPFLLSGFR